jgi:hypothetical protein
MAACGLCPPFRNSRQSPSRSFGNFPSPVFRRWFALGATRRQPAASPAIFLLTKGLGTLPEMRSWFQGLVPYARGCSRVRRSTQLVVVGSTLLGTACAEERDDESTTRAGDSSSGGLDSGSSSDGLGPAGSDETGASSGELPPTLEPWTEVGDEPLDLVLGAVQTVYEPPSDFNLGSFPYTVSVPRGGGEPGTAVLLSFSENEDVSDAEIVNRAMRTTDLGASYDEIEGAYLTNAGLLDDGTLLSVGFVPTWVQGAQVATLELWRSLDGGLDWTVDEGIFDATENIRGLRLHRGLIQIPDGPNAGIVLVAYYALFGSDVTRTVGLMASDDGGATWTRWGAIVAPNHPTLTHNETTFAYTRYGEMIAVTRTHEGDELHPLLICRSDDDGRTFSEPIPIEIAFGRDAPEPRIGVNPGLLLLPNGGLALVGGRPDNWIALSTDGGHAWHSGQLTYVNHPDNHRFRGSSGYQGIAATSSHRLFLVGDNCANSWGCPPSSSGWTIDGEHRIWRRLVDIMPTDPGRIDMASAVAAGVVELQTDLQAEDPALGALALFDGSLEPGSSLWGPGEMLVDFGTPRVVTRIALAGSGGSSSSQLTFFDGQAWFDPQIATTQGGDLALQAFTPPASRPIEQIRIAVPQGGGLAELEIYTIVDSFENEALHTPPRAALEATLVSVVSRPSEASSQMLRLFDTADDAIALIRFALDPVAPEFSFLARAQALPGAILFGVADADGSVLHMRIRADGSVGRYDAGTQTWADLSPPDFVDPFAWFDVTITGDHQVEIGGTTLDVGLVEGNPLVQGYITSAGTIPVGDDVLIDDVRLVRP